MVADLRISLIDRDLDLLQDWALNRGTSQTNLPSSAPSPSFPKNSHSDHAEGDLAFQFQQYMLPSADIPGSSGHPESTIPYSTSIPPKKLNIDRLLVIWTSTIIRDSH
ncbi:hypothetical protein FRC02_005603 [Tulasnella sp. 418]|nr:hypothetical protein FRC02_005603 [Tulasnella sp. 418]